MTKVKKHSGLSKVLKVPLKFSPEDSARLKSDDALMLSIAHDYMKPVSYTHLAQAKYSRA